MAASGSPRAHHHPRVPRGRGDVRRLVDRRVEGDQRVGHAVEARLLDRRHGPVRGAAVADHLLRRARAADRGALPPRPALARQEGAAIPDLDRHRRHRLFRARGRVLRVRRRALRIDHAVGLLQHRQRGRPLGQRQAVPRRQYRPPPADQGRLLPGAPGGRRLRPQSRDALGDARHGARGRKAPSRGRPSQHELGNVFSTLVKAADNMQIYKYVVHNVAHQYGKTATFMPKPIKGDNGSGMHVHQSIWKSGGPTFAGNLYADLSETALYYIGGIIKHAKAINAFTNPTTNSYKRLIPGFEAPVLLAYSARNRSASCRIPIASSPKGKRVEVRFPDPAANPYLGFAAMLMAGLDGIQNKIHPGDAMDKNLYDLPPEELKDVPTVCGSLREALGALEADHAFLAKGDVFPRDQIESYIELKWEEVYNFEHSPHPIEFQMYYSV